MELNIPKDIPDLLDVPEEVMSDFDIWAQDLLSYQIQCSQELTLNIEQFH